MYDEHQKITYSFISIDLATQNVEYGLLDEF